MKLKIKDEELELVYSFRSLVYFEQIANKNIDFNNFTSNDLVTLFYTVVIASLQKSKKPIISMLDFLDVVDDNGGEKCIVEFSEWFIDYSSKQNEAYESTVNEKDKEEKPKGKKKKA